jgi:hypothetical protein
MYTFQAIRKHGRQRIQSNIELHFPTIFTVLRVSALSASTVAVEQRSTRSSQDQGTKEMHIPERPNVKDRMLDITSAVLDVRVT